jgi:hypothetical protein
MFAGLKRTKMAFDRIKLKHRYHDAQVSAIRYENHDVILDVELCSCCNPSPGPTTLWLLGVRNFDAVRDALERARKVNAGTKFIDEMIGIARDADRGLVLDMQTAGAVRVDARGVYEA